MKIVEIDRVEAGFRVTFARGRKSIEETFADRAEAERFAWSKTGRNGCVVSTLDMTPEQLAALREREERSRARLAELRASREEAGR